MFPEHPVAHRLHADDLYLSDVSAASHCLSISPQSIDEEMLDKEAQLARAAASAICTVVQVLQYCSTYHAYIRPPYVRQRWRDNP